MFESINDNLHQQSFEPSYMRKKKLYQQHIRRMDRECIISRLRKNAQLPDQLGRLIQTLPESINKLLVRISNDDIGEWQDTVAYLIVHGSKEILRDLLQGNYINQVQILPFFVFLLNKGADEVNLYNDCYHLMRKKSNQWPFPKRMELFCIFNAMIVKGHSYILPDVSAFLSQSRSNRFFWHQLKFYDIILKKQPSQDNINNFLPKNILIMLSQHIGIHFYNEKEKLIMMQILIQVLYCSQEKDIAQWFNLDQLFGRLQYFFGYFNTNKMIIDRAILLVYNINIDAGSQKFINHNCFKIITVQMKDSANPRKLRSLMAELYLNSIFHYPDNAISDFLKENIVAIIGNIQYIIEEFSYDNEVSRPITELLQIILTITTQQENQKQQKSLSTSIISHASFFKSLQQLKEYPFLLDKFPFLQQHI